MKQQPVDEFDAASQQAGNSTSSSNVTSMCRSREVDIHLREIAERTNARTHARTHTPTRVRAINLRPNSRLPMFVMCTLAANP